MLTTQSTAAPVAASPEFLRHIEEMLELPASTLQGSEPLASVAEWSSLAVVQFMAMADERYGVNPGVERILGCATFDDLYARVAA